MISNVEGSPGHHSAGGREQSPAAVARRYGVHRSWVYRLKARDEAEGEAALTPRSRRPKTSPRATAPETVEAVLRLRKQLAEQGLDAGADTIAWYLTHHHDATLSQATINRVLARHGAVTPEPAKRPKSSYIRFEASHDRVRTTRSTKPGASPPASPGNSATSASADPTPEPTSSSWTPTSTSASSTPPPATSSAN
ncbi:helix-turn-helix domain-containing protein, partial [Pseudonocardia nigra]|uniref:helix-turn-helix domain-containing protein n=1 Tax=Pseudonocardia nigra TaxID=1921578 RepID=UPI001FE71AC0